MFKYLLCWIACLTVASTAFTIPTSTRSVGAVRRPNSLARFMSEEPKETTTTTAKSSSDPMAEAMEEMDEETRRQMEKARRADELRAQEVFMKKSTGKHQCTNCDWEYDEAKGDSMMIGGTIKPGTTFEELPSNWRCPVCRASKDSFKEVVEEIPGFEVNQGYGFGTNAWTSGQKNLAVFGGLALFFLLFLSGYAMN
uniref:Rubredoxin-like domain-containing protein n=1 Tax=Amphora coffeiformis TaxID=265554 RepID=A0A7S3LCR5_9STRA|mmetsp:Transcript_7898/g.15059  ORF Transcript_7898/g.15059 Transcript_7898/m.15059 type:complete len:197 (-) Transcript_7898:139-729(-)